MRVPGKIAIWVFCLVALSIVILQSGNYSYVQDNSAINYGPSGTSAFLELVKRSGYKVTFESVRNPSPARSIIVPVSKSHQEAFGRFLNQLKSKTTVIAFTVPEEDDRPSAPQTVTNAITQMSVGQMEPLRLKAEEWQKAQLEDAETVDLLTYSSGETAIAQVLSKGNIRLIQVLDAACITNLNLAKVDNANISMGLVAMAAKKGEPVQFLGSFCSHDIDDSLMGKLGGPFQAAWTQMTLLVLVIFITLSVRFGLAPESRARQRGGRELIDGLAWMTRRKKNARWALRAVFDRVLTELERRHRVGREQIIQRPDLFLTPEGAVILKDVEAATMDDISEQEAIRYAKALKQLV